MEETILTRAIAVSPHFGRSLMRLYISSDELSERVRQAFAAYESDDGLSLLQQEYEVAIWSERYAEDQGPLTAATYALELALLANKYAINNLPEKAERAARQAYALCTKFYKIRYNPSNTLFFDASRLALEALSLCRLSQKNYTSALKYIRFASAAVRHGAVPRELKLTLERDYTLYKSTLYVMRVYHPSPQ